MQAQAQINGNMSARCLRFVWLLLFFLLPSTPKSSSSKPNEEPIVEFDLLHRLGSVKANSTYRSGEDIGFKVQTVAVLDMRTIHYLDEVTVISGTLVKRTWHARMTVEYFDRENKKKKECFLPRIRVPRTTLVFACSHLCRIALLFGNFLLKRILISGYDTFYDRMVGCYDLSLASPSRELENSTLERCFRNCSEADDRFAAMNGEMTCACLPTMKHAQIESLARCNAYCGNLSLQLCGSERLFSVYATGLTFQRRQAKASWDCLFDNLECPRCALPRHGYNCDRFECRVLSGNCQNMTCQQWDTRAFKREICACQKGFTLVGDNECREINYCLDPSSCGPHSYNCETVLENFQCYCREGFTGARNKPCVDTDECQFETKCNLTSTVCVNTPGSYHCECQEGFKSNSNLYQCEDVDECTADNHNCTDLACLNSVGSYRCVCPARSASHVEEGEVICEKESSSLLLYALFPLVVVLPIVLFLSSSKLKNLKNRMFA